jgi:hypothetical protein
MTKPKNSNLKYILYMICRQWTGGYVMKYFCYFRGQVFMMEVNTCYVSNSFWASKKVLYYCNILIYKHAHTPILSTSAPVLAIPHPAYSLILPNSNHLHCQWQQLTLAILLWSAWHRPQQTTENTTGHRKWETFILCHGKSISDLHVVQ